MPKSACLVSDDGVFDRESILRKSNAPVPELNSITEQSGEPVDTFRQGKKNRKLIRHASTFPVNGLVLGIHMESD